MALISKKFEYRTLLIPDRGHLDDEGFLTALNDWGQRGWKRSEEAAKGSNWLAVLLEREVVLPKPEEVE